jgi:hypothetical protein
MIDRRHFNKVIALSPLAGILGTGEAIGGNSTATAGRGATSDDSGDTQAGLLHGARSVSGHWQVIPGGYRQDQAKGPGILLIHHSQWNEPYSAKVRVRLSPGEAVREAGLLLHYRNPENFVVFSLAKRKGGCYAILRYEVTPGDSMVVDQARLVADLTDWHEIAVDVFGHHIYAYFDGRPIVNYSFIGVSPPSHASDGIIWPDDPTHGQVGMYTRNAAASLTGFEISRRPKYSNIITPQLARHDPEGRILHRQSYAETMKLFTEWMIGSDAVVDKSRAPEKIRHLPPYLLTNWINSDDIAQIAGIQEFAFNHSLLISGAVRYYAFSGDERVLTMAVRVADWHLANRTPADYTLPYLSPSTVLWEPDGNWKGKAWGLEPDKSAFMGICLLKLWVATGNDKYKEAAVQTAATLRKLQRPDGGWPFRVDPKTGSVKCEYTESALWYVKFYDRVAALTGSSGDRAIARRSLEWLLQNPVKTNDWRRLYGDVPCDVKSYDQWVPLDTAMYLLDHRDGHPHYLDMAREILNWINRIEIVDPGLHQGLPGIIEQTAYVIVLTHHELRLAHFYSKLWQATGKQHYRDLAIQIANSVTWGLMSDGKMRLGLGRAASNIPLVLIYNDQFADIMAAIPDTAPAGENHLLKASSDVGRIKYYNESVIKYSTVGPSEDVLVVATAPHSVTSGGKNLKRVTELEKQEEGWVFNPASKMLYIKHPQKNVAVNF